MVNETHLISGYGDSHEMLFGQLYHTPASIMKFWACGISDGDYIDLSDYFEEVYTVQATFNSEALGGGLVPAINVIVSGMVDIMPYGTSGFKVDYEVTGHKTEGGAGFE